MRSPGDAATFRRSARARRGPGAGAVATVRGALANVRAEPSYRAELVSQLVLGEELRLLGDQEGSWVRAAGRDGYAGWVHRDLLVQRPAPETGAALVWVRRQGWMRARPDPDAEPICDLVLGARVGASGGGGAEEGARRVMLPDGTLAWAEAAGWTPEADLPSRFPARGPEVVATGLSLRGIPYLWGGASSKAFDCSGFVQRVLRMHGLELPRDAWQQAEAGQPVEPGAGGEDLASGDLLFFAEDGERVTHVAIALGREGRFVHSSTRCRGVGVNGLRPEDPLHSEGLATTLVACRRILAGGVGAGAEEPYGRGAAATRRPRSSNVCSHAPPPPGSAGCSTRYSPRSSSPSKRRSTR